MRREGRELALQALYAIDLNPAGTREALALFWENTRAAAGVRQFAEELIAGVLEHRTTAAQMSACAPRTMASILFRMPSLPANRTTLQPR